MDYLSRSLERRFLAGMPLEARQQGAPLARIVERLRAERRQAEPSARAHAVFVFATVEHAPDEAFARSLASIALQSHPSVRAILAPQPGVDVEAVRAFAAQAPLSPAHDVCADWDAAQRLRLQDVDFVAFLRHGDQIHPSAAAWIAKARAVDRELGALVWNEAQAGEDGRIARIQCNPAREPVTLKHLAYLRQSFAVDARLAAAYPGNLAREIASNDLHLFQLWLLREGIVWGAHPECFHLTAGPRAAAARDDALYHAALEDETFSFVGGAPYRLAPRRRAASISVVIPYRDKPELTIAALDSIARQDAGAAVEVVLIDNQSLPATRQAIADALTRMPHLAVRTLAYDAPFNHSAQCMLGVNATASDVIVFMNNDAVLETRTALAELAAWALVPGAGSVGCVLRDPVSGEASAGFEIRNTPLAAYDSLVEERSHPSLTPYVREVFGNTFALAAIARSVFDAAGPLDAVRFPNGFNDVEFACRTRALGFTHIALGHVSAAHARGGSRTRVDETPQKLLLRALYPGAAQFRGLTINDIAAPAPAVAPAPRRGLAARIAQRLSDMPFAQRILENPTAYRAIRGVWRFVTFKR